MRTTQTDHLLTIGVLKYESQSQHNTLAHAITWTNHRTTLLHETSMNRSASYAFTFTDTQVMAVQLSRT